MLKKLLHSRVALVVCLLLLVATVAAVVWQSRSKGSDNTSGTGISGAPMAISGPVGRSSLDNDWMVTTDIENQGLKNNFQTGAFTGEKVNLPYSPNAKQIDGDAGVLSHRGNIAWYKRSFTVEQAGDYIIDFGSVNHRAIVWVDDQKVADHQGQFLPFGVKVKLTAGEHRIVVRTDWRFPRKLKKQGWHKTWFNFGGIDREVTVRPVGVSDIESPYVITKITGANSATVTVSAEVRNFQQDRSIQLEGKLVGANTTTPLKFPPVVVPKNSTKRIKTTVKVDSVAFWSPESPNLYQLDLSVKDEAGYQLRTGLREVTRNGNKMLLNGKPLFLRGASIHEDALGRGTAINLEDINQTISELRQIGANSTRAQHPLGRALLEALDEAGIMVWQEIGPIDSPGAWTNQTPAQQSSARRRATISFKEMQAHPSIIVWNLGNEIGGNGKETGQIEYTKYMTQLLKERDPGRLIAVDIWGKRLPVYMGDIYKKIDAIGVTIYLGWYKSPGRDMNFLRDSIKLFLDGVPANAPAPPSLINNGNPTPVQVQQLRDFLAKNTGVNFDPALLPDKVRSPKHGFDQAAAAIRGVKRIYSGKVLAITEFGAEANGENAPSDPGGYDYQSELLKTSIDQYTQDPAIQGALIWNLRDFAVSPSFIGGSIRSAYTKPIRLIRGLNQKGLFTYAGRPKPSVAAVKAAFAAAADARR